MTVSLIGIRTPSDYNDDALPIIELDTEDMHYNVTECIDGIGYIIDSWPNGGGVTTYHRANTLNEAQGWLDIQEYLSELRD